MRTQGSGFLLQVKNPRKTAVDRVFRRDTISDRAPSDCLSEVEGAAGLHLEEWLSSNLIPIDAFKAARTNNFEEFLALRRRAIQEAVGELAEW